MSADPRSSGATSAGKVAEATTERQGVMIRGGVFLIAAKVVYIAAGFVLYFFLAKVFAHSMGVVAGTAALGVWGATFNVMNPVNMMAATGTLQMMSRLVASRGENVAAIFRRCARIQLVLVAALLLVLEGGAPWIAREVLNDPSYVPYLRLAGLIPVFYTVRALYQGYLNGVKRFREQAWLDIGASVLRMGLVLAGAALGFGAQGAIGGFVGAAVAMAVVAAVWIRPGRGSATGAIRTWEVLSFQGLVALITLSTQFLINIDGIAVKALAAADPITADRLAGYYASCQKIAQIPMSLVVALAYVLFPYVASDSSDQAGSDSSRIIRQGMRSLLLLIVPCTAILATTADETLILVFPHFAKSMLEAGDSQAVVSGPLAILALGYVLYAMFLVCTTIITASGRPGVSLWLSGASLVLGWILSRELASDMGPVGAALGVTGAWLVGFLGCTLVLAWLHGLLVSPFRAMRILACGAATAGLSLTIPAEGLLLLPKDMGLAAFFLLSVVVTRELTLAELSGVVRAALGRRAS